MRLEDRKFYCIYNPANGACKPVYGAKLMPALYATYAVADGELKKQKKAGFFKGYEVAGVTISTEIDWK